MRNRIECREAAPDFAHVPPPTLRVPVFDCREDPAPPVVEREYPHAVRPPHHVGRRGDDPPVVGLRGALTPAVRGEQSVRPHDAQHPRAGDADPVQDPKPGVDLAMAFAVERCFRNQLLLLHTYLVLTKPLSHDIQGGAKLDHDGGG